MWYNFTLLLVRYVGVLYYSVQLVKRQFAFNQRLKNRQGLNFARSEMPQRYNLKSSKLWSWLLLTQFKQLRIDAWKSQDFNGVWTRDLAMPGRPSNQLSYEATDVGSWSFVSSNEPVKNGCEVIYEMFHILNCRFWNQVSYGHRSY